MARNSKTAAELYRHTAACLRRLGRGDLAHVLEFEARLLFGDPGVPEPRGFLSLKPLPDCQERS